MRNGYQNVEKKKAYCINKIRDNKGNVIEYVLVNEYGTKAIFDKKHMAMELRNKNAECEILNLQIDSLGRIVDKAVPKETIEKFKNHSKVTNKQAIFEDAYNAMVRDNIMVMIRYSNKTLGLTEPFNRLQGININNVEVLEKEFENYLLQKHNYKASKLKFVNKSKEFMFIVWSTDYLDSYQFHLNNPLEYDNINNFTITYKPNSNNFEKYQKVATVYDKLTGRVVENAFCGLVAYNKANADAVDFAKQNIRSIENEVRTIVRIAPNNNNKTGTSGVTIAKDNNTSGRVTLNKSNSNSVSLVKPNNSRRDFFGKIIDFFNMFKR